MSLDHTAAQLALRNRMLTLGASLPTGRAYENKSYTPVPGTAYLEEDYVPASATLISGPAQGGTIESTGLYVLRWYAIEGTGIQARTNIDALLALFTPGTTLTAGDHTLRIRGDVAPWAGGFTPTGTGWAVCTITIPWRAYTPNTVT